MASICDTDSPRLDNSGMGNEFICVSKGIYFSGLTRKSTWVNLVTPTFLSDKTLWQKSFTISDCHWINDEPENGKTYEVRTRHRAELIKCTLVKNAKSWRVDLNSEIRALTPGQSAVFYNGKTVLGGGIIG